MNIPNLKGVGLGLRSCHYPFIETHHPDIPWFEVLSDNYLCAGGSSLYHLDNITRHYPVTLHGVGMSLGSTDPLNLQYLSNLKKLVQRVNPLTISDHLCWTSVDGRYFHELLPLPYTQEAVHHVVKRIQQVQDFLGRQIMIENVSSYLRYAHSEMSECDFLQTVALEADCLILLDINNIYVSAYNNDFHAENYLDALSPERVCQFHLGGYQDKGTHLLDTHGSAIHEPVWKLFEKAVKKFGAIPTVIEWDNHIPDFPRVMEEVEKANLIMETYANTRGIAETICTITE